MAGPRDDIADAAFRLFAQRGYAETSVDEIAAAAGVSRSTFFRSYGSKEAVIFPDHDTLLARIEQRLRAPEIGSALDAVTDAVKIVLLHYVAEGDRARERYRLTSTVPELRDRELTSSARYQRLFRRYLSDWGDGSDGSELRAEIIAAAVVAAHNRVLGRWLRGESRLPQHEVEEALAIVHRTFETSVHQGPAAVLVVKEGTTMREVEVVVRQALAGMTT